MNLQLVNVATPPPPEKRNCPVSERAHLRNHERFLQQFKRSGYGDASFNSSSVQGTEMRLFKHETDFFSPNGRGGGGGGGGGGREGNSR